MATPYQYEEEGNSGLDEEIEDLKTPYQYVLEDKWDDVKEYFKLHREKLHRQMTLRGDNVLHLAASSCRKSQCQKVLEFLMDKCSINSDSGTTLIDRDPAYKRRSLRVPNKEGNNVLHQVSVSGSVEAARILVGKFNDPVTVASFSRLDLERDSNYSKEKNDARPLLWTRNVSEETPLYIAAARGHTDLVKFYVETLKDPVIMWRHFNRNDQMTALHMAIIGQHFETALWLQQKYPFLGEKQDNNGLTSLQLLAQMPTAFEPHFGQSQWKMLIYHCLPDGELVDNVESNSRQSIDNSHQKDDVESGKDSNHPSQSIFPKKLSVVMKPYYSLLDSLEGTRGPAGIIYKIWKDKKNKKSLEKLIKLLVKWGASWLPKPEENSPGTSMPEKNRPFSLGSSKGPNNYKDSEDGREKQKEVARLKEEAKFEVNYSTSTPLFIATVKGIVPIVKEIIDQHPQAVEHVDNNEHNILHLAIKNRHKEILKLFVSKPTLMSMLNERIDCKGNSLLHQAADRSYYSISLSQQLIGPAMQLQEELHWFQRVKGIVPPHYTIHHNDKNQTAEDLFNYWHDELLEEAQKWVKETAQSCSTVAVLVATVVFAAAYATPGGTNGQNGLPLFQNDPLFLLFTCMDVVAIASSLSSVAFFLSVLSSPLEYPLFVSSIPNKVMAGFILLFISMATTMLAFAATILLLIRVEKKWTKSLLYPVAFFPVPLFGLLQFPMYQSFKVMFHKINEWFFRPLFRPLLNLLGFLKRRSPCGKSKAN